MYICIYVYIYIYIYIHTCIYTHAWREVGLRGHGRVVGPQAPAQVASLSPLSILYDSIECSL